jgi:hypothetical protein
MAIGNLLSRLGQFFTAHPGAVDVAKTVAPGAALNAVMGGVVGGWKGAAGYSAGDFLLNYPLVALARKIAPEVEEQVVIKNAKNIDEIITRKRPSGLETAANLGGSMLSAPLTDLVTGGALLPQEQVVPTNESQPQQIYQQLTQRDVVNNLQRQALSPNTMYQMQGIEHTAHIPGITLLPEQAALLEHQLQTLGIA